MRAESREQIYQWLRRCLIGPAGPDERASRLDAPRRPLKRFQTAILYPVSAGDYGVDPVDDDTDEQDICSVSGSVSDEGASDGGVALSQPRRRFVPPSSVGFSFFVAGDVIELQVIPRAVCYELEATRQPDGRYSSETWHRRVLGSEDSEARTVHQPKQTASATWRENLFDKRAELFVLWRPQASGWLVTISLSNTQKLADQGGSNKPKDIIEENTRALLEVELECIVHQGSVGPYPRADFHLLSDEEQELELRYRDQVIYAIGHGAAVDWTRGQERVTRIRAEFLPKVEVPRVDPDAGGSERQALEIDYLAGLPGHRQEACAALSRFVAGYHGWVEQQAQRIEGLTTHYRSPAEHVVTRMRRAVERMRRGVALLREDDSAALAFGLANQAMFNQMRRPGSDSVAHGKASKPPQWRPFQLAFLLLTLESAINEDAEDRDLLDLIWFPTGGGKTEAYLGLMAFVIWWRRLKYKDSGGGTTVLMRYTLRLLTKDQFRRAARLICAMELIRRAQESTLGREPVSLGLWVGGASSPNSYAEAVVVLQDAIDDGQTRPPSLLVLESCPWCGAAFRSDRNFDAGERHFRFRCTHPACAFGSQPGGVLPCNIVDEALYAQPPTLLLATIDKFARLAWEERTTAFFGLGGNRPPELIIQDELHLISSALGSIAGLYEAGLESALRMRRMAPKYIASTATIRMAAEQVQRLYGREAAIFPPPGLDAKDSYFARTVAPTKEHPGRLYVGYLAPARDRQHCLAPLAAALLAAPEALFDDAAAADRETLLDAWWTLLVYHGSLKSVGVSRNALREIEEWIGILQQEWVAQHRAGDMASDGTEQPTPERAAARWRAQLAERTTQLTSHMSADENAHSFERLAKPRQDQDALDLALATNMVSVGLDVSRLALMVINGQPLTTAEYIQASSRVGRGETPGIVIANYYRDQARSLSHYESFRAYHQAFYRFVEPTSVTPYTYQARLRALHAALVIAARHGDDHLTANARAQAFDPERPETAKLLEILMQRCRAADPGRGEETTAHLRRLAQQWLEAAQRATEQKQGLIYSGSNRDRRGLPLLYSHTDSVTGEWVTLHNMRNVENMGLIKIL
jgi:hypothetical protein